MIYNLLRDPLIQTNAGWHSLPGLFAAMASGEVQSFPLLRPHQRPAWHMFTVQLGVLALDAIGAKSIPRDAAPWLQALQALTPEFPAGEPWHLIVTDLTKPGFLQPPAPSGLTWKPVASPDALDMLITARNHDIKHAVARDAQANDWLFALISLQTMEGYGGAGNHGIARMNGGSSSRVMIGLAPTQTGSSQINPSAWWARDVAILLADRHGIKKPALLWQLPWAQGKSLALDAIDPLFIEVCRRIRLQDNAGRIAAIRSTSAAARIAGKEAKGNTGDPWAPLHFTKAKTLTLGERVWSHKLLVDLFLKSPAEWKCPLLAQRHESDGTQSMVLLAEAFSRGNSKTDGFQSRAIPVPQAVIKTVFSQRAITVAEGIMKDIASVDLALRNGLAVVSAGGDRGKVAKPHYVRTLPARDAFQHIADRLFFPELWRRLAIAHDDDLAPLRLNFLEALAQAARAEFAAACPSIPCASLMRPRAESRGRASFEQAIFFATRPYKLEPVDA